MQSTNMIEEQVPFWPTEDTKEACNNFELDLELPTLPRNTLESTRLLHKVNVEWKGVKK